MNPIAFIPVPAKRSRKRRPIVLPDLTLAGATYQTGVSVTLVFNQPVDISAIAINSFTVNDGPGGHLYVGQSASLIDSATVAVTLLQITTASGPGVTLDVDDANGITAAAGGQAWAGADGLVLPYP